MVYLIYFYGDVMEYVKERTCSFFGHRKIAVTDELKARLCREIENLIINEKVDTFLFGSKSEFDSLCYDAVSEFKVKYPDIKRIYVRAAYADVDKSYTDYLLEYYEHTYFPEKIREAGRASYVERNREMIANSKFCVVYYDKNYLLPRKNGCLPKSGTAAAYDFAVKNKNKIINLCE